MVIVDNVFILLQGSVHRDMRWQQWIYKLGQVYFVQWSRQDCAVMFVVEGS